LPATVKTLFNLPEGLTARDKAANTFEKDLSQDAPRTDTPLTLPVPGDPEEVHRHRDLMRTNALEKWRRGEVDQGQVSLAPLSSFQTALIGLAQRLNHESHGKTSKAADEIQTEHDAAIHVHETLAHFLKL
jgi:hypothetical protein